MLQRFWDMTPVVTRNLLASTAVVGFAQWVLARMGLDLVNLFGLVSWNYSMFSLSGRSFHLWQLITYMFLHQGMGHWFCNMLAVWMFGMVIEREWGWQKYLTYYLICGIGAGLVQQLVWMLVYPGWPCVTIGASGAVFGILLAFAWLFPEQKMFLFLVPIPIPSRVFVGLYALIELGSGVANFAGDNVAHFAHLGGMLVGAALIYYWKKKGNRPNKGDNSRFRTYESKDFSNYHYKDPV
ncbi:MAG: rhomboid family intramembrane serine protease [Paludibacteraceae bacterium]|nr:rhomboid family intramembrane serine protease [Paludibacteraceae bacterium]